MWTCFLCEEEITEGEPFTTVMVRGPATRQVYDTRTPDPASMVPVHWSCSTDAIAARVISALQGNGVPSVGVEGLDTDDFRRIAHELVSRLFDD